MLNIPYFKAMEEKERFLTVLGAIAARVISLKKGSEILNINTEAFVEIIDMLGIRYSLLDEEDVEQELGL